MGEPTKIRHKSTKWVELFLWSVAFAILGICLVAEFAKLVIPRLPYVTTELSAGFGVAISQIVYGGGVTLCVAISVMGFLLWSGKAKRVTPGTLLCVTIAADIFCALIVVFPTLYSAVWDTGFFDRCGLFIIKMIVTVIVLAMYTNCVMRIARPDDTDGNPVKNDRLPTNPTVGE